MFKDMFKDMFTWPLGLEQIILYSVIGLVLVVAVLVLTISTVKARKKGREVAPENTESVREEKVVEIVAEESAAKPAKSAAKPAKPAAPAKAENADDYHVIQNNDAKNPNYKKWRVKKANSNKTIRHYETQKEAIEYATDLANKVGSEVVVHKVDGSVKG